MQFSFSYIWIANCELLTGPIATHTHHRQAQLITITAKKHSDEYKTLEFAQIRDCTFIALMYRMRQTNDFTQIIR